MRKSEIIIDKSKGDIGEQLAEILRRKIITGEYPPGATLPSLDALVTQIGVSHNTVQIAFKALRDLGLVKFRPTVGCVVRDDAPFRAVLVLPEDYGASMDVWAGLNESLGECSRTELFIYKDRARFENILQRLQLENYSGALIYPEHAAAEKVSQLRDSGFPVVVIDNFLKDSQQGWLVDSGLFDAGQLLAETLLQKRYIPVALVAPDNPEGWKFVDGFREAHRKRKESVWSQHVKMLMPQLDAANATKDLLSSPKPLGAIIYARPIDALAGCAVLREAGRNIPVASFGNLPGMDLWSQPVITASRNFRKVGADAGKMLLELRQLPKPQRLALRTVKHRPELAD